MTDKFRGERNFTTMYLYDIRYIYRTLNKEEAVSPNEDTAEMLNSLVWRVYYAAKDGMAIALYNFLRDQSPEQIDRVINQKVLEEDGHYCTPLIIAARNGHDKVVKILIDKFKPDLEQEGIVKFDRHFVKKATALWCAAGAGHLAVVKTLVKAGANVNHCNQGNCTPLRAACFDGRLDIVKYLTEHNADINISDCFNMTCLMLAASKGHIDIVKFLLEKGADLNEKLTNDECTALHIAAECGFTNIVSELLNYGSKMTGNIHGMTPLLSAADNAKHEVVEYIIEWANIGIEERIEAYELLGASYVNNVERGYDYYVAMAGRYMLKAMRLRYEDPKNIIYKELGETIKAYGYWKECETLDSLNSIIHDTNAIQMEALAIRERILGKRNPSVPGRIILRGAAFANDGIFDRCTHLWLHAMHLKQLNNNSVAKDIRRFAHIFSHMILEEENFDFSEVLSLLEMCVKEFALNKSKMCNTNNVDPEDYAEHIVEEETELSMTNTLYILSILTKLLKLYGSTYSEQEKHKAYYLVHKLCLLQLRLNDGQTLLHLAVNPERTSDVVHISEACKFPCAATTKLLVRCGANVNAMDYRRNTPLHVIVAYRYSNSDLATCKSIIKELIEAGAHMDTVNSEGKTVYNIATMGEVKIMLKTQAKLSLKCIAAKAIRAYGLAFHGKVPRSLESFIELHG